MLKKINKVLVSVVIIASIVFFIFANGNKITVPLGYFNFKKDAQIQQHSPPNHPTKNDNISSPPSIGSENTIKKEHKKPVEKSIKQINNEVSHEIKSNTMKFKIDPKYKMKITKPMTPEIGGKLRYMRILVP